MRLTEARNRIEELLAKFVTSIDIGSRSGRTDLNKDAETILIPLLNEVYGWSLTNLNSEKKDYPGIDLADEVAGISIQVTATPTLDKVKKTLKQFIEDNQYLKYSRLIVFILRDKEEPYSNKSIQSIVQNKFHFDPQRDILNHHDLFNKILEFEIAKILRVQEILEAYFGENRQLPDREVGDKVERIVQEHEFFIQRPEQNQLDRFLCECSSGLLIVTADAGFGKTALLANWIKVLQEKDYFVAYHFFQQRDNATASLSRAYRNLLQQLHLYYDGFDYKPIANLEEERRNELYHFVSYYAAQADNPLVILIDALDEAEHPFSPPFPVPLPENVFVVVSARGGRDPEYLRGWTDNAKMIQLDRLSRKVITTWLKEANGGQLAEFAEDNDFISQLDEVTQGYPLYLRYLIDELSHATKQEQNARLTLEKTPKGFEQYVKVQLYDLDKLNLPDERRQFFALLATAKGTLEKTDVKAITGMKDSSLRQLHQCWQVTRWLKSSDDRLYAFAHPRLGEAFAAQLGDDTEDAVKKLIDYCGQWRSHRSQYALRYYAEHLEQSQQWSELFALARNLEFAEAQREVFVSQPNSALKTIQIALKNAVEIDNPSVVAEFVLRHAHALAEITDQESPLQVLHSGDVPRALKLVELSQYKSLESFILWMLLLAWELKDAGQEENVRDILGKLHDQLLPTELRDLPSKALWQGHLVANMLGQVFETDPVGCTVLAQRLLGNPNSVCWSTLENTLCKRGLFLEAIKLRKQQKQLHSLIGIAELQAQKVDTEAAKATYWEIIDLLRDWNSSSDAIFSIAISAKKQLEMGYDDLARQVFIRLVEVASENQDSNNQARVLLNIAYCQIEISDIDKSFLKDASVTLKKINTGVISPSIESRLLREMAKLNAKSGNIVQAKDCFNRALQIAQANTDIENRQTILRKLVDALVVVNFIDDALEIAQSITRETDRSQAFSYILSKQLEKNDLKAALRVVEQDYWDKPHDLQRIAQAQAEARQFEEAIKTVEQIPTDWERDAAWVSIVKAQGQALLKPSYDEQVTDEIFKTIEQKITGHREQAQALMAIAEIQLEQMNFTAAIQTLKRIKRSGERASAQKLLAVAYAKVGNFDEAFVIVNKIEDSRIHIEALEAIAKIQCRSGRTNDARKTYTEMLSASTRSDVLSLKAITLINIAGTQIEAEQKLIAIETLQWASEDVEAVSDLFVKLQLLARLAEKWRQVGEVKSSKQKFEKAIELAERVAEKDRNTSNGSQVFATIAVYKATVGDFDAALEIVEQIPFLSMKVEVYLAIASTQRKIGVIAAQQNLQKLFSDAYEEFQNSPIFWSHDPVRLFCKIAIAQAAIGDKSEAKENLAQIYDCYVKDESKRKVRIERLVEIAIAFTQVPDIDTAIAMLNEIEEPKWRIEVLWVIAYAQFKQNQIVEVKQSLQLATQAYEQIQDESQRAELVGILARIQALAGEPRQAIRSAESALDQKVRLLPTLADIFIDMGEIEYFKQLIIPCSYYLESAYEVCQFFAQIYPEQASTIASIIKNTRLFRV